MSINELEESVAHFLHNLDSFATCFLAELFHDDDKVLRYAIDEGYATVLSFDTDNHHVKHLRLSLTLSGRKLIRHFA